MKLITILYMFTSRCVTVRNRIVSAKLSEAQFRNCIQPICNIRELIDGGVLLNVKREAACKSDELYFLDRISGCH